MPLIMMPLMKMMMSLMSLMKKKYSTSDAEEREHVDERGGDEEPTKR